jgi:hypothetical protein
VTTNVIVTLEQLRDYAEAHPDTEFDLNDQDGCLASRVAGRTMYDEYRFTHPLRSWHPSDDGVPRPFADFCFRFAEDRPWDKPRVNPTGARLVPVLDRLIAGADGFEEGRSLAAEAYGIT